MHGQMKNLPIRQAPGANPGALPHRPSRQVVQIEEITELERVRTRVLVVDFEMVVHPAISTKRSIYARPEARAPGPRPSGSGLDALTRL